MKDKHEFKEGMVLSAVFWPEDGACEVGKNHIKSIRVVMQTGQCAAVAWALATTDTGGEVLYNLALAEGVSFPDERDDDD